MKAWVRLGRQYSDRDEDWPRNELEGFSSPPLNGAHPKKAKMMNKFVFEEASVSDAESEHLMLYNSPITH